MSKDHEMKENIADIYAHIMKFVSSPCMGDDLRDVLTDIYDDFENKLRKNKKELVNDDCPIVVAGDCCGFLYNIQNVASLQS